MGQPIKMDLKYSYIERQGDQERKSSQKKILKGERMTHPAVRKPKKPTKRGERQKVWNR